MSVEKREFQEVVQANFAADFDLKFYDAATVEASEIERHVGAFLGEKLLQPRQESIWIGKDGELDPDYLVLMQNSITYWRARGDERAASRFEHELLGTKNMVRLVLESRDRGESMPIVINASDPGDFYVDQDGRKKSVTFVGLLDCEEGGGWRYNILSLPTSYIGLNEHWQILQDLGDISRTRAMLGYALENITSSELVAYPVILNSLIYKLDDLAEKLGYESWDLITEKAANQLKLEHDETAIVRREVMIREFTNRIFDSVRRGENELDQQALVNAMADIFALEAGKEYLGWGEEEIVGEIKKMLKLALVEKYGFFENMTEQLSYTHWNSISNAEVSAIYAFRASTIARFAANPLAQEARATGCGGSGSKLSERPLGIVGSRYSFETLTPKFEYQYSRTDLTESLSGEPEGMYPEGIYTPGHCRGCDTDRQRIWHTADGGCDCCTLCERRLAGGE